MHFRACDAASQYHRPSPITGSKIPKWGCILNYFSDCPGMNAPNLKSSEQIGRLFSASLNKTIFHIFQNISKYLIRVLRPFKYNNTCDLCAKIQKKRKEIKNHREDFFL